MVDLPQAAAINEGTDKMPQRQFVGQNQELTDKQTNMVEAYFSKVWD
jgi:hypothetical protein